MPRPRTDSFTLDFKELDRIGKRGQLAFDPDEKSYIPLPGPLAVERIHYYTNGAFSSMRLVFQGQPPLKGRVVLDIKPAPGAGQGPNFMQVWVLIENDDLISGVALIECQADGKFPDRPE